MSFFSLKMEQGKGLTVIYREVLEEAVMGLKTKMGIGLLLLFLAPVFLYAEAAVTGESADDLYQGALQAYLTGDFDQAILMDTKALQLNPTYPKAEGLLSILISEKDTARKTVIWIGGKPATVEQAAPLPVAPITILKERIINGASPRVDNKKLAELESRVQTVAFLLERDSFNQYRELTASQVQTTKRLEEIALSLKSVQYGNTLLFFLALIIACFALWNSWRTRQEVRKQKRQGDRDRSEDSRGNDRVVNLR